MTSFRACVLMFLVALSAQPLLAGFTDTDLLIPAVSRAPGNYLSEWYSQIWITNLGSQQVTFQASFYQRDQSNPSPHTFADTLGPSETKRYDNVVENLFGLSGVSGAVRVTASGPVLVSSRTYSLPSSGNVWDSVGQFFTGVPTTFAIGPGETSQLQGITQGWSENFRYNFGMVNIDGGPSTVHVTLKDHSATTLGEKDYTVLAYEALQYSVTDVVGGLSTSNALLLANVTGGTGRVILYGTQIANGSQDSSAFEMGFKNSLLAGGAGVTSLNGLTGAVSLAAGSNIALTPSGNTVTISATSPPGGALPAGTSGQTLRSDGSSWQANSFLFNSGSAVGINTTSPGATLDVNGNMSLPQTIAPNVGVFYLGGSSFLHNYGPGGYGANTFIGTYAGNFTMGGSSPAGTQNTALGSWTLNRNTSGYSNTAIGSLSLVYNTTAWKNTATGYFSLSNNTVGLQNTASGAESLSSNTSGSFNTAAGAASLNQNTTADNNTAVGHSALLSQSFSNGGTEWDSNNTAIGYAALYANQPTSTGNGFRNTAVGAIAMFFNSTGAYNTAVGSEAGSSANSITAYAGGMTSLVPGTTGSYNTFVGRRTGATAQVNNCTAMGVDAYCTGDNQVRLGNVYVSSIGGKVGWSALSDFRAKTGVRDVPLGLDFVLALRPVEYRLRDGNGRLDMGFVAQDIEGLLGDGYNVLDVGADPERTLSLRHSHLIAPLVRAVQEQQATIQTQLARVESLGAQLAAERTRNDILEARLAALEAETANRR
ncbi:MAG: tail fiber domain-containing protein [Thermoanaerobaculia bacterium]